MKNKNIFKSSKKANLDSLTQKIKQELLYGSAKSITELSEKYNDHYLTIRNRLIDSGICILPKSWHTKNKILKAYKQGYKTIGSIANKTRLTYGHVWLLKCNLNLDFRAYKTLRQQKKLNKRKKLIEQGLNQNQIAKLESVSRQAISSYIKYHNLK